MKQNFFYRTLLFSEFYLHTFKLLIYQINILIRYDWHVELNRPMSSFLLCLEKFIFVITDKKKNSRIWIKDNVSRCFNNELITIYERKKFLRQSNSLGIHRKQFNMFVCLFITFICGKIC